MVRDPTMGPEVEDLEERQLLTHLFPLCSQFPNEEAIFPSSVSGVICLISSKPAGGLVGMQMGSE